MIGLPTAASLVGGVVLGYAYKRHRSDHCNGHHWGEHTYAKSVKTQEKAGYTEFRRYESSVGFGKVSVVERGVKQCEDCGRYKKSKKTVKRKSLNDFLNDE